MITKYSGEKFLIKSLSQFLLESIDDKKLEQIKKLLNTIQDSKLPAPLLINLMSGLSSQLSFDDYINYGSEFEFYNDFILKEVLENKLNWVKGYTKLYEMLNLDQNHLDFSDFFDEGVDLLKLPLFPTATKYYKEVFYDLSEINFNNKIIIDFIENLKGESFTIYNSEIITSNKFLNLEGFKILDISSFRISIKSFKSTNVETIIFNTTDPLMSVDWKDLSINFPNLKNISIGIILLSNTFLDELNKLNNLKSLEINNEYSGFSKIIRFPNKKFNKDITISLDLNYFHKFNNDVIKENILNILNYFDKSTKIIINTRNYSVDDRYILFDTKNRKSIIDFLIQKPNLKIIIIKSAGGMNNKSVSDFSKYINFERGKLFLPPIKVKKEL